MSVKVRLHPCLKKFAGGQSVVEVSGHTVAECLDNLEAKFPGMKQQLLDEQGKLHSFYDICVNLRSSQTDPLTEPVKDGDELLIITVIAGG
ncbi:MAG: MoaD/ThiS family protein [Chloroflexi bacterium]|nr:MoaD/ThiS family protein [Chloroflexota bacterium]MBM3153928.1 MoaD/ThiS family protein [Chloroflexota bacterium]MBM3173100.1 MoaD/ThiS family protein [Chloroflexota bacterium]MBM3175272.1 MoaD/ThiS family protein [Chloroflexota bacterium]MBM4450079.1 MoaD/ThiS family protein [Chloroflexota bacterium]